MGQKQAKLPIQTLFPFNFFLHPHVFCIFIWLVATLKPPPPSQMKPWSHFKTIVAMGMKVHVRQQDTKSLGYVFIISVLQIMHAYVQLGSAPAYCLSHKLQQCEWLVSVLEQTYNCLTVGHFMTVECPSIHSYTLLLLQTPTSDVNGDFSVYICHTSFRTYLSSISTICKKNLVVHVHASSVWVLGLVALLCLWVD